MFFDLVPIFLKYIFHVKIQLTVLRLKSYQDPDPQWFGSPDQDPHGDKQLDPAPY
jgi:hypothetical protein